MANRSMRSSAPWWLALCTIPWPVWAAPPSGAPAGLPPDVVKRLDAAIDDLTRGRTADAHQKLQPFLERNDPALHREVDAHLKKSKIDQQLGPLVAGLRVDVVMAGGKATKGLKAMSPIEAGFVAADADARLGPLFDPIDKELADPLKLDQQPADRLVTQLTRCTTLLDQLEVAGRLQALRAEAFKQGRRPRQKEAKKEDAQNQARSEAMTARVVELAVAIIPTQLGALRDPKAEFTARAKASSRLEDALAVAKKHYPRYKASKGGKTKAVGGKTVGEQLAQLKEREQEFDKLAGALRVKVYHLEQGKHWWLRGRWGVGPYHDGLTKAASGRPPSMEAFLFYPLMMPNPVPKAVSPLRDPRPLPVSRRHLDVWKAAFPVGSAFARAQRNLAIGNVAWQLNREPPGAAAMHDSKALDGDDDFNPFVGYLEYHMALYHWTKLLQLATAEELVGIEKSVASDDSFMVPSYLSRQYDSVDPTSTLRMTPIKSDDPRAEDAYERRGLSWCIALAQIEICGIRATFTGLEYEPEPIVDTPWSPGGGGAYQAAIPYRQPRSVRPFDRLAITPYTRKAVAEILWDGMRQQYYRVRTEVVIETNRVSAPNEFLAPVTRLAVALEFIRGYKQHFGRDLTPAQNAELLRWQRELEVALTRLMGAWANNLRAVLNAMAAATRTSGPPATLLKNGNGGAGAGMSGKGNTGKGK